MSGLARHRGLLLSGGASGPDPLFAFVRSLLHLDGADGATTISDVIAGRTWTRLGTAAFLSDDQQRFGPTALRVTGLDSDFSTPFGIIGSAQQCSIEGWVYVDALTGPAGDWNIIVGQGGGGGSQDQMLAIYQGKVTYYRGAGLGGATLTLSGTSVVTPGTWNHVEFSFTGSRIYLFLNGNLEASIADTQGWLDTGRPFRLGRQVVVGYEQFRFGLNGYLDEIRVTAGAYRHTASFTPPAAPYPNN